MNEQRPNRQLELAGILCVVLGLLAVVFDTGGVVRVVGVLLIALGAGALLMKARQIRARQEAERLADLRARAAGPDENDDHHEHDGGDDHAGRAASPGRATPRPAHTVPTEPRPADPDLIAAAGRTLATLVAHGVLHPLDEAEVAMAAAAVSDAGEADLATVLGAVGETAGLGAGDPLELANQVEQDEGYFTELVAGFAALAGVPIEVRALSVDWPEDGVQPRATRVRAGLDVGGDPVEIDVKNWTKYLAPAFPVLLARAVRQAVAPRRLAAYALEDTWVVGLPDDDAELARFNSALGLPDRFGASFGWLDAEEPAEAE